MYTKDPAPNFIGTVTPESVQLAFWCGSNRSTPSSWDQGWGFQVWMVKGIEVQLCLLLLLETLVLSPLCIGPVKDSSPVPDCVNILRDQRQALPFKLEGLASFKLPDREGQTGWCQSLQIQSPADWLKMADVKSRILTFQPLCAELCTNSQLTRRFTSNYGTKWATQPWGKPYVTWSVAWTIQH